MVLLHLKALGSSSSYPIYRGASIYRYRGAASSVSSSLGFPSSLPPNLGLCTRSSSGLSIGFNSNSNSSRTLGNVRHHCYNCISNSSSNSSRRNGITGAYGSFINRLASSTSSNQNIGGSNNSSNSSSSSSSSSSNGNSSSSETLISKYERKTPIEHVLLRPGMYVGQVEVSSQEIFVMQNGSMTKKMIKYPPALLKIFDEIVVNSADNRIRSKTMNKIEVNISKNARNEMQVSVLNNGLGIPVEVHPTEKIYNPELIFGHLLTGSNFDDSTNRLTGGRHGYGAKLTNIFSKWFEVETFDSARSLLYKQKWETNMSACNKPIITKVKLKEDYTKVTFVPDLSRFGGGDLGGLSEEELVNNIMLLFERRVYDIAGCTAPVRVYLNNKLVAVNSFSDYVSLYSSSSSPSADSSSLQPASENEPIAVADNSNSKLEIAEGEILISNNDSKNSSSISSSSKSELFYLKANERWEVVLSRSRSGTFEQVSFVNCVWTSRGGSHINHVMNQVVSMVQEIMLKNNVTVSPYQIKNKTMLYVKCNIESPSFDSQSKDTLTSNVSDFGSTCILPKSFIKKFIEQSGILEELKSDMKAKELARINKTTKSSRQIIVDKLEDAHLAGTSKSDMCTLILTEGDSAKALAVSGLEIVGRQYYGVLPLRGKFLNVRNLPVSTVSTNKEVVDLAKALGLDFSKKYANGFFGLRYGHILIMCDQDHDGSHIKGLIINYIHEFWPELLKQDGYLQQFITPILKATVPSIVSIAADGSKDKSKMQQHSFFSIAEFNNWKMSLTKSALSKMSIKYYKGLGTSSAAEGREYFSDLSKHQKSFLFTDNCSEQIDLVFNKTRSKDRKEWLLSTYAPGIFIDPSLPKVSYSDFINKEMVHFSHADNIRSIPSVVDGLKPSQRKVLYGCFKKNITSEIKVVQLAGYISEHTCYHHGEVSLHNSIVNMAQDFVGSNNVPYLLPLGQFGSRAQGGSDAASPRYIFTKLSPLTRYIFREEDDAILDYIEEDGTLVEPQFYVPVIPSILINGAKGIGTGWSVSIPPYNPLDLIRYIENELEGKSNKKDLVPWINGFQGSIVKDTDSTSFEVSGVIKKVNDFTYNITELPYEEWTESYKNFLVGLQTKGVIKEFVENHTSTSVQFEVKFHKQSEYTAIVDEAELYQIFKLKKKLSYQNMNCFDRNGMIKKFQNPREIISHYIPIRLEFYARRKEHMLQSLSIQEELVRLKSNFIRDVMGKKIILFKDIDSNSSSSSRSSNGNRSNNSKDVNGSGSGEEGLVTENSIHDNLRALGYPIYSDILKKASVSNNNNNKSNSSNSSSSSSRRVEDYSTSADMKGNYAYLLDMPINSLTEEKSKQLFESARAALETLNELKNKSPKDLWMLDLTALKKVVKKYYLSRDNSREK